PVGFDVAGTNTGSNIIVSEARFLTPDFKLREEAGVVPQSPKYSWQTGSLSSYRLDKRGNLKLVSADVLTGSKIEGGEIANCWVTLSPDGRTLWAANALSSSISSFRIDDNARAKLKNATAYKDDSERLFFSDMAVNNAGTELYQLIGNEGEVAVFQIDKKGNLELRQTVGQMPALGTFGLAVIEH
ncbi:MAG: beta-propeller fold lactonase family protein, partial [Myxococcota bacterium]